MKQMAEILLENFNTIGVIFNDTHNWKDTHEKQYTYKVSKDIEVEAGDIVIVKANGQYKFVRVVRVDEEAQIDLGSDINYQWIIQKLDLTKYNELNLKDAEVKKVIAETERQKMKRDILTAFSSNLDEETLLKFEAKCAALGIEKK